MTGDMWNLDYEIQFKREKDARLHAGVIRLCRPLAQVRTLKNKRGGWLVKVYTTRI